MHARFLLVSVMALQVLLAPALSAAATPERTDARRVRHLQWVELLPEREREGYFPGPPPANHGYLDGLGSRSFGRFGQQQGESDCSGLARRFNPECVSAGPSGMSSAVNEGLDGQTVRLEGYIVPLEVAADGRITEFFLAAYMGACIHVPPPPPNQMVYAKVPGRQAPASMYDAYAITGVLHTRGRILGIAGSAYSLDVQSVERLR